MTGCQTARVAQPLTVQHGGNDDFEQLEFWHSLAGRPVTSNDEAFHGLLLFLEGSDPGSDYPGRVAALRSRRLLQASFNQPADEAVDRGTLAVAIVRALHIEGGVGLRLLGGSPLAGRYAVRELQFMELFPASSPNQTFSGTEFLGIIGKLEDYRRGEAGATQVAASDTAGGAPTRERGMKIPPEPRPGAEPGTPPGETPSGQPL
jgi:hypothetical protein